MKNYTATLTFSWSLKARNEEQAQERAFELAGALSPASLGKKPWLGDMGECEVEVECDE